MSGKTLSKGLKTPERCAARCRDDGGFVPLKVFLLRLRPAVKGISRSGRNKGVSFA
jgi:hypothetical protein